MKTNIGNRSDTLLKNFIICIVDDNTSIRDAASLLFESYGWEVRVCASGEEFLACMTTEVEPNFILMDNNLPGISGLEVTEILSCEYPDIPVVILSSHLYEISKSHSSLSNIQAILSKPVATEKLIEVINTIKNQRS